MGYDFDYEVNREYKDRLFRLFYADEGNKEELLALAGALNDTEYDDVSALEITTLGDAIYIKMKNDISFLISSVMSIYEHQSTFNPNMPFRQFEYGARLLDKYIAEHDLDIYGKELVKIPTPQCYVFYNGTDFADDEMLLRLSDAFEYPQERLPVKGYEWTVKMLNINAGHNRELMKKCASLREYAEFIQMLRDNINSQNIHTIKDKRLKHDVLKKVVDETVTVFTTRSANGKFSRYLKAHRAEVIMVCLTEYSVKVHEENLYKSGKKEGIKEGMTRGRIISLYCDANWTEEAIAEKMGINLEEVKAIIVGAGSEKGAAPEGCKR